MKKLNNSLNEEINRIKSLFTEERMYGNLVKEELRFWKLGCIEGDCENGQGTYTWASDDKYVGEWKDDKMHGQGTYTWASDDKYVGEWKDDKMHGQGTMTSPDGWEYVGEYKDGKRHGQGTFTWANDDKYVGEFKDEIRHGQGTYTYADGVKYVGEYKDGKRHGQGTYTYADGRIEKGVWENGESFTPEDENDGTTETSIECDDYLTSNSKKWMDNINGVKKWTIRKGSHGYETKKGYEGVKDIIKYIQCKLGFTGGGIDGIFGTNTLKKLEDFQKDVFPTNPQEWDGIVGPNTLYELVGGG